MNERGGDANGRGAVAEKTRDDVKPVLDKIKDTYARMGAAGSSVSQLQQCTKIISVLDNSWDNLIPTLNSQQDQWTPEWLRQQILQEDFRRRHVGGGAATKTAEGYGAAGHDKGRGGWRGRGRGRSFGRGRGRGDYNEGHGSSGGRGSTRMEGTCWYCKKVGHPWFNTTGPAKTPLALVHMDVVGPTRAPSLLGSRYFLTIVDDHTRAVWVYPLKSKGEVAAAVLKERDVRPPVRLTYGGRGKPNVVQAGSVVEQIEEDEIAHCYWAPIPEPKTREEALNGPNGEKWKASEDEEFGSLIENETWDLCDLPPGKKAITSKMIYRHNCRAKLGKKVLWSLEEETSCIKDLWQLPIIPWNGKTPTAATAAAAKATAGGDATAPTDGVLEAVKKVQKQQTHGEVLAGVDASAAWAKASSRSGEADWETWHERLCHVNFPMLQKLVKNGSLKGLEVKGEVKEIGSCPTCLETKFSNAEQMLEMQFKCSKMGEVKYYLGMHVERDVEKGVLRLHQRKYCEGWLRRHEACWDECALSMHA
ncbi:hypothetical protein CLOP_g5831 [Closterium sp. NIES-67]|nr:hypothetical protein CLOP_g5831 [Closterium sp. NIES-67]